MKTIVSLNYLNKDGEEVSAFLGKPMYGGGSAGKKVLAIRIVMVHDEPSHGDTVEFRLEDNTTRHMPIGRVTEWMSVTE